MTGKSECLKVFLSSHTIISIYHSLWLTLQHCGQTASWWTQCVTFFKLYNFSAVEHLLFLIQSSHLEEQTFIGMFYVNIWISNNWYLWSECWRVYFFPFYVAFLIQLINTSILSRSIYIYKMSMVGKTFPHILHKYQIYWTDPWW